MRRPDARTRCFTAALIATLATSAAASAQEAPRAPAPLEVPGFKPASHVPPAGQPDEARPVVVVLHGNFDRPEWECDIWKDVVGAWGWVLCPRGVRSSAATLREDRWTYASRPAARRELRAALDALDARYPGRVRRDNMVLVGFSLGAIMAPRIALEEPGLFTHLFLVEGGVDKLTEIGGATLQRSGVASVGMAMAGPWRRVRARRLVEPLRRQGLRAELIDMEEAGHGYSDDFAEHAQRAFKRLVQRDS